ncbi:Fic family protein [Enterococcus sp.]|uniref:Fic family protein n=1 Tax=Enterococcus sp. TaxID=35783 RepID=UPI00290EA3DC|nr:Fic family protein [Enterococcus sp.]MDU5337312.1 Fic family protein [Enterococcus sp.]
MSYKEIKKHKYMREDTEKEFHSRFDSTSAMKTSFYISPIENGVKLKSMTRELWVNSIPEITSLVNDVQKASRALVEYEMKLSKNQYNEFIEFLLIEEMQATNEYEGVKSTKQELKEALDSLHSETSSHRFKGLSLLYSHVGKMDKKRIYTPKEIREIYDELVSNEITDESKIEKGSMFRKDKVTVGDRFSTVHVGEDPERIADQLQEMLNFLNTEDREFSSIIKVLVSHFMFEYIHPFYDGNGRVGRYILAKYLSFELDAFSSLLMSSSVVSNRQKYEKSFVITTDKDNFAEGTFFVLNLLDLLQEAQQRIDYLLEDKIRLTNRVKKFIDYKNLTPFQDEIFWIYFDHGIFGNETKTLTRKDIRKHFADGEWSEHKQRKADTYLEEEGMIERVGENPAKYRISPYFINSLKKSDGLSD